MIILKKLIKERVSKKVLGIDALHQKLLDYIKSNYSDLGDEYIEERTEVTLGMTQNSVDAYIPTKILQKENWNEFFKRYGYYIGNIANEDKDFPDDWEPWNTKLQLYPYETNKVKSITSNLYHVTPKNNLLKIKSQGLTPRKSDKTFSVKDPRIYLVKDTGPGRSQIDDLTEKLRDYTDENPPFGDEMAVLEVDPSKVKGSFYEDPEMDADWSVYTRSNIPSNAIINWNEYQKELRTLKKRE